NAAEPALLVVAAAEEDQIEGPPGIELPLRRYEERALRALRGALRGGAGEVLVVGVAEEDGAQPLLDADAVEDPAAHEARALEGARAAAEHDEQVLPRLEPLHLPGVLLLSEQGLADVGGVGDGEVQLDEGLVPLGAHVRLADLQVPEGALGDQPLPGPHVVALDEMARDARGRLDDAHRHAE